MILKISFFLVLFIVGTDLLGWNSNKTNQLLCGGNNNKLLSLLNILCNMTQLVSITTRDACYGCFFRAGNIPPGTTLLLTLSQCASLYLNGTAFSNCVVQLQSVVSGIRPTPTPDTPTVCYTGYCEFVRCVRRINANALVDQCFLANLVNRDLSRPLDRQYFYTNTTSCILAQTRCNLYNPITGQYQPQPPKYTGQNLANALQITPTGDIRVISFPVSVSIADFFCSTRTQLDQSTYGNSVC